MVPISHDKDDGGGSPTLPDSYLSHAIYLERYKTHEANRLLSILDTANEQIKKRITAAKAIETKQKYKRVAAEIKKIKDELTKELNQQFERDGLGLIDEEENFVKAAIINAAPSTCVVFNPELPAPKKVWYAAAFESYAANGHETFSTFLNGISNNLYKVWDSQVRAGYLTGMTAQQINRAVLGSVKDLEPGMMQSLRNSLARNTRTMVASLAETARDAVYRDNASIFDGYVYLATLDTRTCLICGGNDGKKFETLEKAPKLPAHYNCVLGDTQVSTTNRITNIFRRRYEGEIIIITTASGKVLRCTPNHPVLCDSGFVPAKVIQKGHQLVIDDSLKIIPLGFRDENTDQKKSRIEDVFRAFSESGKVTTVTMPLSSEDFHGDVTDKEVEIIRATWKLSFKINVLFLEIIKKISLILRISRALGSISGKCRLATFFKRTLSSFGRFMCLFCKKGFLLSRRMFHAFNLLFPSVSLSNSIAFEKSDHIHAAESKLSCNTFDANPFDGNPFVVKLKNILKIWRFCAPMYWCINSSPMKNSSDGFVVDPDLSRYILNRHKRLIKMDDVLSIERLWFSGHVYNFETKKNWYVANGIITHNCRCLYLPVIKGREGLDIEERASVDGPVDGAVTWKDWLAKQPDERQLDILGPTRYAMYKAGVDTGSFVTDARVLSLSQLIAKEGWEMFGGRIKDASWQAQEAFAGVYYDSIRNRRDPTDIANISQASGFSEEDVLKIRNHLFVKEHDLDEGRRGRFAPSSDIALAWMRMEQAWKGNKMDIYKDVDLLLLSHELEELTVMVKYGYDASAAHEIATKKYPWARKIEEIDS